ncbi:MAG: N-acetylneuraminate synthase family protein [Bacillota bacterium]|nr:N-acetylneuraminate synthase family protein [Bacillota bacterium]MDW7684827.1 N-acetylneuraminate synthase family protein [Bacillota bacterium]
MLTLHEKIISDNHPVFIIAEAGVNHNGSVNNAIQLVDAALNAGADAIKFQLFNTAKLNVKNNSLLKSLEFSKEKMAAIKQYCDQSGILFLCTPFDEESASTLQRLNVEAFKIGSGDLTNLPLLNCVASFRKPIILSTGMSGLHDIETALTFLPGTVKVALLHCTSAYPAPFAELNLNVIHTLKAAFGKIVGYSDHSQGLAVPFAAAALGYKIIEKHITLDKNLPGPDHIASMEPADFKELVCGIRNIEKALGSPAKQVMPSEQQTKKAARRGIYLKSDLPENHKLTVDDLMFLRPLSAIEACHYQSVIGKVLTRPKRKGTSLTWQDLLPEDGA